MSSEWIETTIGELVTLQRGHDLPVQDRAQGHVPVMGSAGITGYHDRHTTKGPGVVIGRSGVGSMGVVSYIDRNYWALNTTLFVKDFHGNDERFIYYLLKTINFRQFDTGSAQASLNRNVVYPYRVRVPNSLQGQRRIASVLTALEDRIILLRETNATLEAIAQALFKSWFVDFDPVRAKMAGRAPDGMDEATAALFPDALEETELGVVPKGWRVGTLGDILSLRNERALPSVETRALPYVPIESIGAKTPFLAEFKSGEEANSSLTLFREGDILFGAMRPYFHKVCIVPFDGVTRTTVFTLFAKNPKARAFALLQVYQDSTIDYATQHSEGSTIPYAKWKKSLEKMAVVTPPDAVQEVFSNAVVSLIDRANANVSQAQSLAILRDTLLPRLISGQLRLPEAQDQLEAAA